jgi:methyl-accepting chemotaxis protein
LIQAVKRAGEQLRGLLPQQEEFARALQVLLEVSDRLHQSADAGVRLISEYARARKAELENSERSAREQVRQLLAEVARESSALAGAAEELTASSRQMGSNAQETLALANLVSGASDQVRKNVQTVTAASQDVSRAIQEIARNASAGARTAAVAVEKGNATSAAIAQLGTRGTQITEILKVITAIAQQTNLLALNAMIESARAGEAGKGFGVVANEVKDLSQRTGRATDEIERLLNGIQSATKIAIEAVQQAGVVVLQMHDVSNNIAAAVDEHTASNNEIRGGLEEVSSGSRELAELSTRVAQAAEETSLGVVQVEAAAGGLARMAGLLRGLLSRFAE